MTLPLALEAKDIACERGGRRVFSNLSFNAHAGELLEVRGVNGAGKSSLLRLLAGLNAPAAGTIRLLNGKAELSLAEQAHYIGHAEALKPVLTVAENLQFWSQFMGGDKLTFAPFKLDNLANVPAMLLSAGQKRRLALSRLGNIQRAIWLLDEPDIGLDAASRTTLQNEMERHLASGGIILAATHTPLGVKSSRSLVIGNEK